MHEKQEISGTVTSEKLGLLYDPELAALLRINVATLKNRRARGDLPPSSKIGREHVTLVDDLKRWIARRRNVKVAA